MDHALQAPQPAELQGLSLIDGVTEMLCNLHTWPAAGCDDPVNLPQLAPSLWESNSKYSTPSRPAATAAADASVVQSKTNLRKQFWESAATNAGHERGGEGQGRHTSTAKGACTHARTHARTYARTHASHNLFSVIRQCKHIAVVLTHRLGNKHVMVVTMSETVTKGTCSLAFPALVQPTKEIVSFETAHAVGVSD